MFNRFRGEGVFVIRSPVARMQQRQMEPEERALMRNNESQREERA